MFGDLQDDVFLSHGQAFLSFSKLSNGSRIFSAVTGVDYNDGGRWCLNGGRCRSPPIAPHLCRRGAIAPYGRGPSFGRSLGVLCFFWRGLLRVFNDSLNPILKGGEVKRRKTQEENDSDGAWERTSSNLETHG